MNSFEIFDEIRVLSDEDDQHAIKVWNEFRINNIDEYHDLHLKTDVVLLADVFEEVRNMYSEHYGLEPRDYFSSPGLSSDTMLKMTGAKLHPVINFDLDQLTYMCSVEKFMKGRVSFIGQRNCKLNTKYKKPYKRSHLSILYKKMLIYFMDD